MKEKFIISEVSHKNINIFQKEFLKGFFPILSKLDYDLLDQESGIEFNPLENSIEIKIIPQSYTKAELSVYFSEDQLILSFAESEQIECHSKSSIDYNLINKVLVIIDKYLYGLKVIEYRNQKNKLFKTEYYEREGNLIGVSELMFLLNKSIISKKEYLINFYK